MSISPRAAEMIARADEWAVTAQPILREYIALDHMAARLAVDTPRDGYFRQSMVRARNQIEKTMEELGRDLDGYRSDRIADESIAHDRNASENWQIAAEDDNEALDKGALTVDGALQRMGWMG